MSPVRRLPGSARVVSARPLYEGRLSRPLTISELFHLQRPPFLSQYHAHFADTLSFRLKGLAGVLLQLHVTT